MMRKRDIPRFFGSVGVGVGMLALLICIPFGYAEPEAGTTTPQTAGTAERSESGSTSAVENQPASRRVIVRKGTPQPEPKVSGSGGYIAYVDTNGNVTPPPAGFVVELLADVTRGTPAEPVPFVNAQHPDILSYDVSSIRMFAFASKQPDGTVTRQCVQTINGRITEQTGAVAPHEAETCELDHHHDPELEKGGE